MSGWTGLVGVQAMGNTDAPMPARPPAPGSPQSSPRVRLTRAAQYGRQNRVDITPDVPHSRGGMGGKSRVVQLEVPPCPSI